MSTTALPRKVLIIEDEGEMCLLLNILLDKGDMQLDHVKSLQNAKEFLATEDPAVVILDNKLPDGMGVNFISYIKASHPDARIIMMSGYGGSAKDAALENGADVFMEKPFTRDQLYQSINSLMS